MINLLRPCFPNSFHKSVVRWHTTLNRNNKNISVNIMPRTEGNTFSIRRKRGHGFYFFINSNSSWIAGIDVGYPQFFVFVSSVIIYISFWARYYKRFDAWQHLVTMLFCSFRGAISLRELSKVFWLGKTSLYLLACLLHLIGLPSLMEIVKDLKKELEDQ